MQTEAANFKVFDRLLKTFSFVIYVSAQLAQRVTRTASGWPLIKFKCLRLNRVAQVKHWQMRTDNEERMTR